MWKQLGRQIWEWRGVWITAPSVAGIIIALRFAGWLQPLEWAALDQFFRWRLLEPTDSRIVIVGITESDIQKKGWPVSDAILAQLLEKLKAQQPQAIGLDLYRDLPVPPGNQQLVKVFETTPNLVGIEKKIGNDNSSGVAPSPVLAGRNQVGFNDIVADADGKLRRGLLFLRSPSTKKLSSSFGLRLALIYLEAHQITPEKAATNPKDMQLAKGIFPRFQLNDGGYVRADAGGYQILLNFRGPARSFQTVSMTDVLQNRIPQDLMRDRIVLIGATASSLNDVFQTPYSITTSERTPGVEIQANLISQIISAALEGRPIIQVWHDYWEWLWIGFWSFIGVTFSWILRSPRRATLALLLTGSGLIGGSYLAFLSGWWLPVVPPILALVASATTITGYIAQVEREERQTVMNLFGRHVTPQIAEAIWHDRDQLLKEGRLLGRRMTATVLFTDLRGFSTVAEMVEPEELMFWLNEYMEAMAQLVLEHGGVVDKFIGDAVMAVFGVPIPRTTPEAIAKDAVAAVSCAVAMAHRLKLLNEKWLAQGRPTTTMRVGIATGPVVTGSLGSTQRLDYTTIGDSVNVAARLESYDKSVDGGICRILVNEETYQLMEDKFPTKIIGGVMLKGREHLTNIHQILLE